MRTERQDSAAERRPALFVFVAVSLAISVAVVWLGINLLLAGLPESAESALHREVLVLVSLAPACFLLGWLAAA